MYGRREISDETFKNNILIGEFWGYQFHGDDPWYKLNGFKAHYWIENPDKTIQRLPLDGFRFDYDWNWILPVVKKIMNMNFDTPFNGVLIDAKQELYADIRTPMLYNDIDEAYKVVVNFINIYNKNKR